MAAAVNYCRQASGPGADVPAHGAAVVLCKAVKQGQGLMILRCLDGSNGPETVGVSGEGYTQIPLPLSQVQLLTATVLVVAEGSLDGP
jgi:hypothetical protein